MWALRSSLAVALVGVAACSGTPPAPSPVTLIAKNTLAFDIFVPDTYGEGGMAVETPPSFGAGPLALVETAPCSCLECANACALASTCDCTSVSDGGSATGDIHRIAAGQSLTRVFSATAMQATRADCGVGDLGPICYQPASPIAKGTYELELCYATDAPGIMPMQSDLAGSLTASSLTCVTKSFAYPGTSQVIIEPAQPPPCNSNGDCPSGQLCQMGLCSASCLASGVPMVGSSWGTSATVSSNEALLVSTDGGNGVLRQAATATVGTANYVGDELDLLLYEQMGMGRAEAEIRVALAPGTPVVPLSGGETVSVLVITSTPPDSPTEMLVGSTAATIRDGQGNLLLAADQGFGGLLLQPGDLSPFSLDFGGELYGCDTTSSCGKLLYHETTFTDGSASATVAPGQTGTLTTGAGTYAATVVGNTTYTMGSPASGCGPEPIDSFDLVLQGRQL